MTDAWARPADGVGDAGRDRGGDAVDALAAGGPTTDPEAEELGADGLRAGGGADVGEPALPSAATEGALEALLFVAEKPLARAEIARALGCDRETVDALVGDLETSLASRGIRLVTAGEHVALATAPEAGPVIARYVGVEPGRLSPASLEVLAIVAYRQPVTKAIVERIRGVDSDYTLRTLLHRRLVVELGRADAPGRPILYGTGIDFLERFGLASLEDLPPLESGTAGRLVDAAEAAAAETSVPGAAG
jgi:segregation and condensation protein B